MQQGNWILNKNTPNLKWLSKGDRVLFYLGSQNKQYNHSFVGSARLANDPRPVGKRKPYSLLRGKKIYTSRESYIVKLDKIMLWREGIPIESVLKKLDFIENKKKWGLYLIGGVRKISSKEYKKVLAKAKSVRKYQPKSIKKMPDIELRALKRLSDHSKRKIASKGRLLIECSEGIPRECFSIFADHIKEKIEGKAGIYALYDSDGELYYVGLTNTLNARLKQHLIDRHKDEWDSFSLFFVSDPKYLRDLEKIILLISSPPGNKTKGKLPHHNAFRKELEKFTKYEMKRLEEIKKAFS